MTSSLLGRGNDPRVEMMKSPRLLENDLRAEMMKNHRLLENDLGAEMMLSLFLVRGPGAEMMIRMAILPEATNLLRTEAGPLRTDRSEKGLGAEMILNLLLKMKVLTMMIREKRGKEQTQLHRPEVPQDFGS